MNHSLEYIFVGIAGSVGIILLAGLISIVGVYLIPGRNKGALEEDFSQIWQKISIEQASRILTGRLKEAGFEVSVPEETKIFGTRPKNLVSHRGTQVMTCESMRVYATVVLTEKLQDVEVALKLKYGDYILLDITESAYLKVLGEYFVSRNPEDNKTPVIPWQPDAWAIIFVALFLGLLLSLSILTPLWPKGSGYEGYVLHINGFLTFLMALQISQLNSASNTYPELIKHFRYSWMFMTLPLISSLILYFHLKESHLIATIVYSVISICPLEILERMEESNKGISKSGK